MTPTAESIMTRDVVTARPEDSVAAVAKLLCDHGVSAAPVCDEQGRLLGMVSEGDLMRPFGQKNKLKRSWWLSLLAEGTGLAPEFLDYLRLDHRTVRTLMTSPVVTAPDDSGVPDLADLLIRHNIKRVPIVREGKLVGIVSRADIVRALAREPETAIEIV